MAKILLTGGAGFIGSHLADRLLELGHQVTIIDNLSTGKKENLNPKADFIHWDISEVYFNGKWDYVFHLAALPGVPYSIEHPTKTHRVNITGTYNILKAAKDSNVKKVIFASTCALYDEGKPFFKEDDPIHPKTPYAFQKAVGEGYMRLFNEAYGLPTVSLRFFNVYGSRSDPNSEYSLVISKFKQLRKEGKPLTIYGNGSQTRDFIYVGDVVSACISAMEKPIENEVINVCTGKGTSINEIADLIGGKKIYLPERRGDALYISGDNTKAQKLLDWKPQIDIKTGINSF